MPLSDGDLVLELVVLQSAAPLDVALQVVLVETLLLLVLSLLAHPEPLSSLLLELLLLPDAVHSIVEEDLLLEDFLLALLFYSVIEIVVELLGLR